MTYGPAKKIAAFITTGNPLDRRVWSGTYYFMLTILKSHFDKVVCYGPLPKYDDAFYKINKLMKLITKTDKIYYHYNNTIISKHYAYIIQRKLLKYPVDILFIVNSPALLSFLRTEIPKIYIADATFKLLINYYGIYSNFLMLSEIEGNWLEKRAINNATAIMYSSNWARRSAIKDYCCSPGKVHVVPFGANIDEDHIHQKNSILYSRKMDTCRLLFVGTSWERKGGTIAYETMLKLNEMNFDATLTVIGCEPPLIRPSEKLEIIPFINKNDEMGFKKLSSFYLKSHFFLMPTRADCTPIVFCEANSFGLPVITTDTGGVSSLITNGKNGFLLPISATGKEYAGIIKKIFSDKTSYEKLRRSSRETYDEILNWKRWGETVSSLIRGFI